MYIAIDTSNETASLALLEDGHIFAEMTWRCGQNHSVQLLPGLTSLLERQGIDIASARGLIVARGPGSYNGLRVGLSAVKGLAFGLQVPVVGISTLEVEAYQQAGRGLPVCALINAGRGEVATAIFRNVGGEWVRSVAEHLTTIDELCNGIVTPTIFCGDYARTVGPAIREKLRDRAVFVSPAAGLRRAGFLAELGYARLKAQDYDDPGSLQPLYLRAVEITEPRHR
jgi:tRNA threonylcarbamoyladenosine biosynthesis protein TsaB